MLMLLEIELQSNVSVVPPEYLHPTVGARVESGPTARSERL